MSLLSVRSVLGGQAPAYTPAAPGADRGKYIAELPTKKTVAETAPVDDNPAAPGDDNPKVQPGKVAWHPDVETAGLIFRTR